MIYRFATIADANEIVALVNNHGGYVEITRQVAITGGDWFLAVDDTNNNMIAGCVWGIKDRQHASIDYLTVHTDYQDGLNWRALLDRLFQYMQTNYGINFFHGLVRRPDGQWAKIVPEALVPLDAEPLDFYSEHAPEE